MANTNTGSRSSETGSAFLAGFLAGEIQRNHGDAIYFPGLEGGGDAAEFHDEKIQTGTTDARPSCSNCCNDSVNLPCLTDPPVCDTKVGCRTQAPQCPPEQKYGAPKHASWLDRP